MPDKASTAKNPIRTESADAADPWVWYAMTLFVLMVGVIVGVARPLAKRISERVNSVVDEATGDGGGEQQQSGEPVSGGGL